MPSRCSADDNRFPHTVRDVGESLSMAHDQSKVKNRKSLVNILQNVKFLGRQGLALVATTIEKETSCSSLNLGN